jgi:hypothetical protein
MCALLIVCVITRHDSEYSRARGPAAELLQRFQPQQLQSQLPRLTLTQAAPAILLLLLQVFQQVIQVGPDINQSFSKLKL